MQRQSEGHDIDDGSLGSALSGQRTAVLVQEQGETVPPEEPGENLNYQVTPS